MALHPQTVLAVVGGEHEGLNPWLNGAIALAVFAILLIAVTRLNRDR